MIKPREVLLKRPSTQANPRVRTQQHPKRTTLVFLFLLLGSTQAMAQDLGFRGNIRLSLDGTTTGSTTFTITHRGAATDYFLTFGPGQAGSFEPRQMVDGTNNLSYYLVDNSNDGNILKDLSASPNNNEVLTGFFPEKTKGGPQSQDPSFTLEVRSGAFVQGNFTDSVTVSLYRGTLANYTLVATATATLEVRVRPVLELAILEPGRFFDDTQTSHTIDFGIITPGSSGSADLIVRSNSLFSVTMSSQNAGVMVYSNQTDPSTIPYDLYFNSSLVNLASGGTQTVLSGQGPTDITGDRYPLYIEIPSPGFPTEGSYVDAITITLVAN